MVTIEPLKRCSRCREHKPVGEFYLDRSRPEGREPYCKVCRKTQKAQYYKKHRDEIIECRREYSRRPGVRQAKQEYERRPEVRARRREQDKRPGRRARKNQLRNTPEAKAKQKEYDRLRNQKPELKLLHREQVKRYGIEHPEWLLVQRAKQRAKRKGVLCNIRPEDISIPDLCPVLGIPLRREQEDKSDYSPSLDEIILGVGYVVGNVAVISDRANRLKSDGTAAEHLKIADWMDAHKTGVRKLSVTHKADSKREKRVVQCAKQRAHKKGLEFNLALKDIEFPDVCPVLDVSFESGNRYNHENAPSLDRVDSSRGYTLDNVAVISHRANLIKSDGTADEHRRIADWMVAHASSQRIKEVA